MKLSLSDTLMFVCPIPDTFTKSAHDVNSNQTRFIVLQLIVPTQAVISVDITSYRLYGDEYSIV
jgi:hypothetical protein